MKKKAILTSIFIGFISLYNINKINSDANFIEYIQKILNIKSEILRVESKPNEDYIRLDWDFGSSQPYTYKVFKKNSNRDDDYQSISNIDLSQNSNIKVLNIYPTHCYGTSVIPSITFTNWKNETFTLPKSANLKQWMEEPNNEDPKGYGKGILDIYPIDIKTFNSDFETILKDENNQWNYDVIYVGHWDGTGNTSPAISDDAVDLIGEFIDSGRGVLAGHDSLGYRLGTNIGLGRIRDKFNIKVGYWDIAGTVPDEGHNYYGGFENTKICISKKGLLTNYPWNVGEIGGTLNIPRTHSTSNFAYGDIWMTFDGDNMWNGSNIPEHLKLYSNYYLTTYNNTAMIQTGHSNGNATPDEQKLLANTLFYLSQLNSNNYLDDMSGQDVNAPEKPVISTSSIDIENNKFIFNLENIEDIGTKYSYYVEATGQDDGEVKTSNIAEAEIKSGLKGYSYVVDTNKNTEPNNEVDITNNTIEFNFNKPTSNKYYLHIKSIDNVGNFSETVHYEIGDTESPTLELTTSNTDITNGEVPVIINSEDNTKVDYILLPNNQKVYLDSCIYNILEDGEYIFRVYDIFGNFTEKSITINNIDKEKPSVIINKDNIEWTNNGVQININTRD